MKTPDEPGRDDFGGLRCDFPGCKKVIHAMTGLQEIQKLQAHMRRAHRDPMGMLEALDHRVAVEDGQTPSVARLARKEKYLTPAERNLAQIKIANAIRDHDAKRRRA